MHTPAAWVGRAVGNAPKRRAWLMALAVLTLTPPASSWAEDGAWPNGIDPHQAIAYCHSFDGLPTLTAKCMAQNLELIWDLFNLNSEPPVTARVERLIELWEDLAIYSMTTAFSRLPSYSDSHEHSRVDLVLLLLEPAAVETSARYPPAPK